MAQLVGTFGMQNNVEKEQDWESVKNKIKDMKSSKDNSDDEHPFIIN